LFAWTTELQSSINESNLQDWTETFIAKAKAKGSHSVQVAKVRLGKAKGESTAEVELTMKSAADSALVMFGTSMPVEGQVFHVATVSMSRRKKAARRARDQVISRLEVLQHASELKWGGAVEGLGSSATLDGHWRLPKKNEQLPTREKAQLLPLPPLAKCWAAIHPLASGKSDVMFSCQEEKQLGIVNEYTFEDRDLEIRDSVFKGLEVPVAEKVELHDRLGFYYLVQAGEQRMHLLLVPIGEGMSKTVVLGQGTDESILKEQIIKTAMNSSFSPVAKVEMRDKVLFYLTYRPLHPYVICPVLGVVLFFVFMVAIFVLGMRKQQANRAALEDY